MCIFFVLFYSQHYIFVENTEETLREKPNLKPKLGLIERNSYLFCDLVKENSYFRYTVAFDTENECAI